MPFRRQTGGGALRTHIGWTEREGGEKMKIQGRMVQQERELTTRKETGGNFTTDADAVACGEDGGLNVREK